MVIVAALILFVGIVVMGYGCYASEAGEVAVLGMIISMLGAALLGASLDSMFPPQCYESSGLINMC